MLPYNNILYSNKNRKIKILNDQCRICSASAKYLYFGVISCESCKVFFKRNANTKQSRLKCNLNNQCEININTRHICTSCRLDKCFKCGMTTDKFRAPRSVKSNEKSLVKIQKQHQPEQLSTLNLLQSDTSLLDKNQWILLSNLINSYNESKLLSISQHLIDTHEISQYNYTIYQSLVQDFTGTLYETTGRYLCSNEDFRKLSSDDRSIILRNAADNVSCISCQFIMHYFHLLELNAFSNGLVTVYGKQSIDLHRWAMKFIDQDTILIKLAFSLFALSGNAYSYYENVLEYLPSSTIIFEIQNKYIEITWKYLIYKYGNYEAIKRFVNLLSWLLALTILISHAQTLTTHVNDVNSLVEQTELTLILDDVDEIIQTES